MAEALSIGTDGSMVVRLSLIERRLLGTLLGSVADLDADYVHDQEAMFRLHEMWRLIRVEAPLPHAESRPYGWIKTEWGGSAKLGNDNKPVTLADEVAEGKHDQPHP